MARRYEALTAFLSDRPDPVVEMTFAELDRLVGGLPDSARKYPAWWTNSRSSQPHAKFWLDAKRRATPDFNAGRVRFVTGAESAPNPRPVAAGGQKAMLNPTGETVEVGVQFVWLDAGVVALDVSGKLGFYRLPSRPGIYRFTLTDGDSGSLSIYIGESDNLARRMSNYRNPGPKQLTNERLQARILETLAGGGKVSVSVALEAAVDGATLDFTARPARLLAENAALIRAGQQGHHAENL